jgi:hypothetical protein
VLNILHAFARIYQKSAAGRRGVTKDYTVQYESFLRSAGAADGDEREIAEKELVAAERQSNGLFGIDRHPRSGDKLRLRLARVGGEEWLFSHTGLAAPSDKRTTLAAFFEEAASRPVPDTWQLAWKNWFSELSQRARNGLTIQPFKQDDPAGNAELVNALSGILLWQGEALVRYASASICGDSKRLQALEPRLRVALAEITGQASLESFGIFRKPRSVTFHGPLVLQLGGTKFDFSVFPAPVTLSETNFTQSPAISTTAPLCLTVENEDVFFELATSNPGILIIQTSFPGSAALRLLKLLPADLPFHHFGDSDPAGSDILRDLREKTGRPIRPLLMRHRQLHHTKRQPLGEHDIQTLKRLLKMDLLEDLHPHLTEILEAGEKGSFEQESIPVTEVWEALAPFIRMTT